MCEFKVILETGQDRQVVARGVVKAKTKDGTVFLMDSAGTMTRAEGAAIRTVDTMMAEMVLRAGEQDLVVAAGRARGISDERAARRAVFPEELLALRRFHGHLGPYVTIGMRMGQIARDKYPNRIFATLLSGTKRPLSCVADGVQFASCCTIGKSNIVILEEGRAEAMFTDGRSGIGVKVKDEAMESVGESATSGNEDELSLEIYHMKDDDLFAIVPISPSRAWK